MPSGKYVFRSKPYILVITDNFISRKHICWACYKYPHVSCNILGIILMYCKDNDVCKKWSYLPTDLCFPLTSVFHHQSSQPSGQGNERSGHISNPLLGWVGKNIEHKPLQITCLKSLLSGKLLAKFSLLTKLYKLQTILMQSSQA